VFGNRAIANGRIATTLRVRSTPGPILWIALAVVVGWLGHWLDRAGVLALTFITTFLITLFLAVCLTMTFWPYATTTSTTACYGPYAYAGPVVQIAAAPGASVPARNVSTAGVARAEGSEQRVAEVCNNNASDLTDFAD
jgi:hypothetical protein